jgi:autotransporter-associated beta strand protein
MKLNGPVEFRDGTAIIRGAQLAAVNGTVSPFGSGDLRLRNARVFCDERSGAGHGITAVPIVTGSDSALVYEGACEVAARNDNAPLAKAVTINAIRRSGPGSALYLRDGKGTSSVLPRIGEGNFSTVKLAMAPEVDEATGLLKEPVIIANMSGEYLATYDDDKGFVPHDTAYGDKCASDIASAEGKIFSSANSAVLELDAGKTLHVAAVRMGNFAKVTLYDNAKLCVGNGTDPAMLLTSVCGKFLGMNGTIDFGSSEAIISCNNCTGVVDGNNSSIACKIAGSGGVTFVADPDTDRDHRIELHGSNTYTGGTRISAVRVGARSEKCFSSGDVHVLGGEASGGAVIFKKNATWANNFHIAGHGYHDFSVNSSLGCIEFKANAVLSGSVEMVEEASVNVSADFTGTITGTVSGDRLKLYNSQGILKLSGQNTYTGGTEVARSTLAVSAATGLGTGEVLLDGGSVEFCNAAAMTVANDWRGIGIIRLGSSEVRFTGKIDKRSDIALDCPNDVTFTEIPPFGRFVNSSPRASTLTLAAGDHVLDVDAVEGVFNLVLEDGARLDLGGKTLVVRRFIGERSQVNGIISETNPQKGGFIVIR